MKRFVMTATLLLLAAGGCSLASRGFGFRDLILFQDMAMANRNKNEAYKAWKIAKWDYYRQGVPHYLREHIGRGFQQGFVDVASGGSGELPLFPPNNYWSTAYQNPRGNEMIAAWFRGYSDGAVAGERSGLSRYVTLPTSSAVPMPAAGEPAPPVDPNKAGPLDFLPENWRTEPVPPSPPPPPPVLTPTPSEVLPAPSLPNPLPPAVPPLQPAPIPPPAGKQVSNPMGPSRPAVTSALPLRAFDAVPTASETPLR